MLSFCSVVGRLGFRLNGYYCKPGFMLCKVLLVKFINFLKIEEAGRSGWELSDSVGHHRLTPPLNCRLPVPSQILAMLDSLYLCGYEGVKFEIMHSLHNSLSVAQKFVNPAKSEFTSPSAPRRLWMRELPLHVRRSGLCTNTNHPEPPPSRTPSKNWGEPTQEREIRDTAANAAQLRHRPRL